MTLTFRTAQAPFLATRTLLTISKKNYLEEFHQNIICHNLYIDDLMTGSNVCNVLLKRVTKRYTTFEDYGMHLCKILSNYKFVIPQILIHHRANTAESQ
jgi:hypothetical protein